MSPSDPTESGKIGLDERTSQVEYSQNMRQSVAHLTNFLSDPKIIDSSLDEYGMLLPLDTMNTIITKMLLLMSRNVQLDRESAQLLRNRTMLFFDNSRQWQDYFRALCEYKDFFDGILGKNAVPGITEETRRAMNLDTENTERKEMIMTRLSITSRYFTRFIVEEAIPTAIRNSQPINSVET